jgi:hypothetical protein
MKAGRDEAMLVVEALTDTPVARRRQEIVERKGLGHPDTICDSIVEAISIARGTHWRVSCRVDPRQAPGVLSQLTDRAHAGSPTEGGEAC